MSDNNTAVESGFDSVNLPQVDLAAVIADFRRFSRFFGAVFVVVFVAIFVPLITQAPKYTATSSVMIDPRQNNTTPGQDVLSGLPPDTTTIDTETEILKSNTLADRVLVSLHLDKDPEFNSKLRSSSLFGSSEIKTINLEAMSPLARQSYHQSVINKILSGLSIKRQGLTRIITVSFTSLNADKSRTIANEWARLYLSQQLETKYQATREANEWLNSKLGDLRTQVEAADTALQQYKVAHNLMSTSGDTTLAQSEMTTIDQQLAGAKADQAQAEARVTVAKQQLAGGSTGEDVGAALDSQVIKDLRQQKATISQHLADLGTRYGPLLPDIIKSKRQMEDIDAQIQAEVKRLLSNLEAEAHVARQRSGSLAGSVSKVKGQLATNNAATVKLNELQRNAEAVTTLYQSYLDRFKQTATQEGLGKTDARIVANADLPTGPSEPKAGLVLALSFAGSLALAVAAVLIRRALDSGITTGVEAERILNEPFLGSIADFNTTGDKNEKIKSPVDYIKDKPLSAFAEGFRNLRAALLYSHVDHEVKIIAITSSLPGEGKTTTSVCLAQTMAMSGQKVLLMDCDLRRRSVNKLLGIDVSKGLIEILAGTASLVDVLYTDPKTGVQFLPLASSAYTPKDVFGSKAFDDLLAYVRTQYDIIILDTAPILPVVDTRILARKADSVAMIMRWRKTQRNAVKNSLHQLKELGVNVSGVALTQVNIKDQAKYGYGDGGYYYSAYKKYYN